MADLDTLIFMAKEMREPQSTVMHLLPSKTLLSNADLKQQWFRGNRKLTEAESTLQKRQMPS